jgi:hypothetical protein
MFTIFFGTMMIFLIALPSMNCFIYFRSLGEGFNCGSGSVHGDFDHGAHLGIHGDKNLALAFDEQGGIKFRPRSAVQVSSTPRFKGMSF